MPVFQQDSVFTIFLSLCCLAKHYLNYIGTIPVVVMEFVKKGCLRSFLNNFKSNVTPNSLTQVKRNFLLYGKQIADGMEYLVSPLTLK